MKKVALIMGGPGSEHEVSLATGRQMLENLSTDKYAVKPIFIDRTGSWRFGESTKKLSLLEALDRLRDFEVALLALHGTFGEDGKMQGLLESIKLPYTGSGVLASAVAMDKVMSTDIFRAHGLRVPESIVISRTDWQLRKSAPQAEWPVIVKPVSGGSSVGAAKVSSAPALVKAVDEAFKWDERVLIQKCLEGREFTCGVLERGDDIVALPPTEIIPKSAELFDYTSKYTVGASLEITPPKLSSKQIAKLQDLALTAHRVLGCRSYSRTDFMLDAKGFVVLETNTLPGLTETSLLPQAAAAAGLSFPQLLDILIANAVK
ncbi:MAG: D-alanine--D-alanine ligase [Patescibacteria group bacterium]